MTEGAALEDGAACVRVMTDEQMEVLRRQISAYATICEQLVEMHRAVTAQQNSLSGMRMTALYADPLMPSGGTKISSRQRWTPTPMQLQILEGMFYQGNGTPSRHKIKEITSELAQHGQISETNVYNWFQNRRARSKRKQMVAAQNNAESEAEAESQNEKKARQDQMALAVDEHSLQDVSSELRFISRDSDGCQVLYPGDIPGFGDSLSNPMFDSLMAKVGTQVAFDTFQSGEDVADSRRVLREQEF